MKKLTRSVYDRKLAGICGGIGNYYNIDPNIIRVLFLILFGYLTGFLLIAYIIFIFIIPNENTVR